MRKQDLVNIIAKDHDIAKSEACDLVDDVFAIIMDHVASGGEYHHTGFGKFSLVVRKPRKIYNVNHRAVTDIPEKIALKFVPSRHLNKWLNSES